MTDRDEKLAHLLDDFPGDNPSADLDEVINDVNLQYQARRYRMIGEAMRNELPDAIDMGFHSSVMARIREEAPSAAPKQTASEASSDTSLSESILGWFSKPLAGLAVAATVAVVTVALWTPGEPENAADGGIASVDPKVEELIGEQTPGAVVTVSTRLQPGGMRWKVSNDAPALQQKLNGYLVNHTEYSNSVQGLIPQARVAGFDSQQ